MTVIRGNVKGFVGCGAGRKDALRLCVGRQPWKQTWLRCRGCRVAAQPQKQPHGNAAAAHGPASDRNRILKQNAPTCPPTPLSVKRGQSAPTSLGKAPGCELGRVSVTDPPRATQTHVLSPQPTFAPSNRPISLKTTPMFRWRPVSHVQAEIVRKKPSAGKRQKQYRPYGAERALSNAASNSAAPFFFLRLFFATRKSNVGPRLHLSLPPFVAGSEVFGAELTAYSPHAGGCWSRQGHTIAHSHCH